MYNSGKKKSLDGVVKHCVKVSILENTILDDITIASRIKAAKELSILKVVT